LELRIAALWNGRSPAAYRPLGKVPIEAIEGLASSTGICGAIGEP
jgi:hypothetical protein